MAKDKLSKAELTMTALIKRAAEGECTPTAVDDKSSVQDGDVQANLFRGHEIRKVLHDKEWWYSIVDIMDALTDTSNARSAWYNAKLRLKNEKSEVLSEIKQLKMRAADGKNYDTDCANVESLFRILQSVSSPSVEPVKRWLAKTGYERILERQNPEIAIKRVVADYRIQGRSDEWIRSRLQTVISRVELTDEWRDRGIRGVEYAILTDEISKGTFDVTTGEHKQYKGLGKNHSLRDHMTGLELVLTMLGEEATKEIAINTDAQGFLPNKDAARSGGQVAGAARKQIEQKSQKRVLSESNFLTKRIDKS